MSLTCIHPHMIHRLPNPRCALRSAPLPCIQCNPKADAYMTPSHNTNHITSCVCVCAAPLCLCSQRAPSTSAYGVPVPCPPQAQARSTSAPRRLSGLAPPPHAAPHAQSMGSAGGEGPVSVPPGPAGRGSCQQGSGAFLGGRPQLKAEEDRGLAPPGTMHTPAYTASPMRTLPTHPIRCACACASIHGCGCAHCSTRLHAGACMLHPGACPSVGRHLRAEHSWAEALTCARGPGAGRAQVNWSPLRAPQEHAAQQKARTASPRSTQLAIRCARHAAWRMCSRA